VTDPPPQSHPSTSSTRHMQHETFKAQEIAQKDSLHRNAPPLDQGVRELGGCKRSDADEQGRC